MGSASPAGSRRFVAARPPAAPDPLAWIDESYRTVAPKKLVAELDERRGQEYRARSVAPKPIPDGLELEVCAHRQPGEG